MVNQKARIFKFKAIIFEDSYIYFMYTLILRNRMSIRNWGSSPHLIKLDKMKNGTTQRK